MSHTPHVSHACVSRTQARKLESVTPSMAVELVGLNITGGKTVSARSCSRARMQGKTERGNNNRRYHKREP